MGMREGLVTLLVLVPMSSAILCALFRPRLIRSLIVLGTGAFLVVASLWLVSLVPFRLRYESLMGLDVHRLVQGADFLLLFVILYFGFKHRHAVIVGLTVFQILAAAFLEFFLIKEPSSGVRIYCDQLSLIMVLIISIVGSLICFQAIPYMKNHEAHHHIVKSRQPRFFFVMLLFLGAMNGLVLANDLILFYFFFELTTLCSFLLIGHDRTAVATRNAIRALWMNSIGGAAFVLALIMIYQQTGVLELQGILLPGKAGSGVYLLALALFCLAAFTKSAQFPFQSWLLGAMVAPTPVSALLHSSTMVKVGVYLVLRLAPAINATLISQSLAVFGAFSFLAGAALAVGQSNGKKVLAYSTISNLGLIFACAGLSTPEAMTAGILLLTFHAVIKALLFLCVGTIEQHIASREIEDMRGLYGTMPLTALITVMGVIMMIMPPFGVLLSKWMAMEAAARNLYAIIMMTLGSGLTVMYWARWAGTLMSDPFAGRFNPERQPFLTWLPLGSLCAGGAILSVLAPWLYVRMIAPVLEGPHYASYIVQGGILQNAYGTFAVVPLAIVAVAGFIVSILAVRHAASARTTPPYLSGLQTSEPGVFRGPFNQPVHAEAKNYYLSSIFGEKRLTAWINMGAAVLLMLIIGGGL